jgi:phosphate transport system substrate-binding protein
MKKLLAIVLMFLAGAAQAQTVNGAGATFPAPIYTKWASMYDKETGSKLNYQSIGSGGGIRQIESKTVDFGATDEPMTEKELKDKGLFQFPAVIGGVVPVVNIKGIEAGQLVLDGKTLADIFEGKIINWSDDKIKKLNPKLTMPDLPILVVVRADSSGTTAVFTDYLSQVSKDFKESTGVGKAISWKAKGVTSGKGNAGVSAFVKQLNGSIGYVEYAFAKQGKMAHVALKNRKDRVIQPDDLTFAESAKTANWSVPGYAVNLNNLDGWPITAATFILIYEKGATNNKEVIKFFDFAFNKGNKDAEDLDYVPLPDKVKTMIRADWKRLGL